MTTWKDYPDTTTPLTAAELNRIEEAIRRAQSTADTAQYDLAAAVADTNWLPCALGTGWGPVTGHPPIARVKSSVLYTRGAVVRTGSTVDWNNLFTLPTLIWWQGATIFLGACVGLVSPSNAKASELFLTPSNGRVAVGNYSQWLGSDYPTIPISAAMAI